MTRTAPDISAVIDALRSHYGGLDPMPTSDPFELVLWENVAYLASPSRRAAAFQMLKREVSTSPQRILEAPQRKLERVAAHGILKQKFAAKLRACAEIALDKFQGDLRSAIAGPVAKSKSALRLFPGIGEPGAEKVLLYSGVHPFLAADSNALRVLTRLGFIKEEKSYARTYAASRKIEQKIGADFQKLRQAHELLQHHGQMLCKRSKPACKLCPLAACCAYR
jgi:endonuclease III